MSEGGQPVPTANRLAQTRNDLSTDRTVMAADRTLMAWIRTTLSMLGFGFTIYKFLTGLKESATIHLSHPEGPRYLGLLLTALGTGGLVAGILQYLQMLREIGASARARVTFYVACAVAALGLTILLGIASRGGPF